MSFPTHIDLIQNIAILLSFSLLHDYMWLKDLGGQSLKRQLGAGLIIGTIVFFLMLTPWTLIPGVVFDTRSILISISGLYFGAIPTIVAMAMASTIRILQGGDGMYMGIAAILLSGLIGLLWRWMRPIRRLPHKYIELLVMGIIVHWTILPFTLLLPQDIRLSTFMAIAPSIMIIYPVVTMLLGILMERQLRNWKNREAQASLLESERRFSEVLNCVHLISVILDSKARVQFCNHYLLNATGYAQHEVLGQNWLDLFIAPDDKPAVMNVFQNLLSGQKDSSYFENSIRTKDGRKIYISWHNIPLRDPQGRTIGTASIGENTTDRKLAEEQKLKFGNILDASLNEIYLFDAETLRFEYVNYGAMKNLGIDKSRILELSPPLLDPEKNEVVFRELISPLRNGFQSQLVYETKHLRTNGTIYDVEVHLQLVDDSGKKMFLAVAQDISQRKTEEELLRKAKARAEESDKLKSIFLANMSHEIRTPMNAIIGFSGLMAETDLPIEKRNEYANIVLQSGNKLLQIIGDIIDASKLEAKQLRLSHADFNAAEEFSLCTQNVRLNDTIPISPNVYFSVNIPAYAKDRVVNGDKERFKQIVDNLLTNAFKYTLKGNIRSWLHISEGPDIVYVEVGVTDTGIGIPKEKQHLIFQRFRQVEENEFHRGTGLGLSICKGLVDLMGGQISFKSESGVGSTFKFIVPFQKISTVKTFPMIIGE
ncbi:MAG: PAS domain S-box protein [Breznakibacter sp.]